MTTIRCKFPVAKRKPTSPEPSKPRPSSRAAGMLALAHHIERLVEAGELPDYAAAASALGVTRSRMTQIMRLLILSPALQERVLVGDSPPSERGLRRASAEPVWEDQQA